VIRNDTGPGRRRSEVAGVTKIAILDDYVSVALDYGDWSALPDDAEITVSCEAIPPERLVDELSDYEIIVITQQRARFPRTVLESLPNLKLLVCNRRTSNVVDHPQVLRAPRYARQGPAGGPGAGGGGGSGAGGAAGADGAGGWLGAGAGVAPQMTGCCPGGMGGGPRPGDSPASTHQLTPAAGAPAPFGGPGGGL
jgi:hypothetical protein